MRCPIRDSSSDSAVLGSKPWLDSRPSVAKAASAALSVLTDGMPFGSRSHWAVPIGTTPWVNASGATASGP